jgi:hypothetical protein
MHIRWREIKDYADVHKKNMADNGVEVVEAKVFQADVDPGPGGSHVTAIASLEKVGSVFLWHVSFSHRTNTEPPQPVRWQWVLLAPNFLNKFFPGVTMRFENRSDTPDHIVHYWEQV